MQGDENPLRPQTDWTCCASIKPQTDEEWAAWRQAMPKAHDSLSPLRRLRAFARALAAMAVEQAGLPAKASCCGARWTSRRSCTVHRSQTVYHGPVFYTDPPVRWLEQGVVGPGPVAARVPEARRAGRSASTGSWCGQRTRPRRIWVDLGAFGRADRRHATAAAGIASAGVEASSTMVALAEVSRPRGHVAAQPRLAAIRQPDRCTAASRATAALNALKDAVTKSATVEDEERAIGSACEAAAKSLRHAASHSASSAYGCATTV